MSDVEVLALEIKQCIGQDQITLIPRIYGQSAKTEIQKGKSRPGRTWDEPSFLKELGEKAGPEEVATAVKILEWARSRNLRLWWGKGAEQGSCYLQLDHSDVVHYTVALWTSNRVEVEFYYLAKRSVYSLEKRNDLRLKLNQIPDVNLGEDAIERLPSFPITKLNNDQSLKIFFDAWDEYINETRHSL